MADRLSDDLTQVDPIQAWEPAPDAGWDLKWAGHLYRRAAFGASPDELRQAVRAGRSTTLKRLLEVSPPSPARVQMMEDTGRALARRSDQNALRTWWLYFMLYGGDPLREKLTVFWHNHFATSVAKVNRGDLMLRQNLLLRQQALGKFGPFAREISRDPAMLIWLDSNQNVKGRPNENYAREVMELFTLGVGHYRESDVREAARAFTGWHADASGSAYEFHADQHDSGVKTVLGQTGNWNGDDVLRILLEQPACAQFLARKLYGYFVSETDPPARLLEPLAGRFRKSDYDIGGLVKAMLGSRLFFSKHAYRQRVKSPVELIIGAARGNLPGPIPPEALAPSLETMGQPLFAPPNVKGWPGGRSWLNQATLLARNNFAEQVAMGTLASVSNESADRLPLAPPVGASKPRDQQAAPDPSPAWDAATFVRKANASTPIEAVARLADHLLDGEVPPKARARLESFASEGKPTGKEFERRIRETAQAMMCIPEYQLA